VLSYNEVHFQPEQSVDEMEKMLFEAGYNDLSENEPDLFDQAD
jgi:hypothetical protein